MRSSSAGSRKARPMSQTLLQNTPITWKKWYYDLRNKWKSPSGFDLVKPIRNASGKNRNACLFRRPEYTTYVGATDLQNHDISELLHKNHNCTINQESRINQVLFWIQGWKKEISVPQEPKGKTSNLCAMKSKKIQSRLLYLNKKIKKRPVSLYFDILKDRTTFILWST